jgi:hypothetical protein
MMMYIEEDLKEIREKGGRDKGAEAIKVSKKRKRYKNHFSFNFIGTLPLFSS